MIGCGNESNNTSTNSVSASEVIDMGYTGHYKVTKSSLGDGSDCIGMSDINPEVGSNISINYRENFQSLSIDFGEHTYLFNQVPATGNRMLLKGLDAWNTLYKLDAYLHTTSEGDVFEGRIDFAPDCVAFFKSVRK